MIQKIKLFTFVILLVLLTQVHSYGNCSCSYWGINYYDEDYYTYYQTCDTCPSNCYSFLQRTGNYYDPYWGYDTYYIYACNSCPLNCLSCSSPSCTTCDNANGYYKYGSLCKTCWYIYGSYCDTCNDSQCLSCDSYSVDITGNGSCQSCSSRYSSGCRSCDLTQCSTCYSNYYMDGSNCLICSSKYGSQCYQCTSIKCTNCYSGSYADGFGCTYCNATYGSACQSCSSTQCNSCDPATPSILSSGQCKLCSDVYGINCLSCNSGQCLSCNQPAGYYLNAGQCKTCQQLFTSNCLLCTSAQCTTCDQINGYFLSSAGLCKTCAQMYGSKCSSCQSSPAQCKTCDFGYFLKLSAPGSSNPCVTCSFFKCTSCIAGPKCDSCQIGFFLNATIDYCMPCYFPCTQCSVNATTCTKCQTNQKYYLDSLDSKCKLCYHSIDNCQLCDLDGVDLYCLKCNSTLFYLDSSTKLCTACINNCKQCLSDIQCLSCIDYGFLLNTTTKTCDPCSNYMPDCTQCLSSTVCLECDVNAVPTVFLSYPPRYCLQCQQARPNCQNCIWTAGVGPQCDTCPTDLFFLELGFCQSCPQTCQQCTSMTVCSVCINNQYAISGTMCTPCSELLDNCVECSDSLTCTRCVNNTVTNGGSTCVGCLATEYGDDVAQQCFPCVSPCQSCLNEDDCSSCVTFYSLDTKIQRCLDTCGDSVVMTSECDNGLGVLNDGCSDSCEEQPDYTCVLTAATVSSISVQTSICSYDLAVDMSIISIVKEPYKNTMTWTYSLKPFLFGLPGTISRQFTQDELKLIFLIYDTGVTSTAQSVSSGGSKSVKVGSGTPADLTIDSVSTDSALSQVSVTFSYDSDIKFSQLELFVDFDYLRTTLTVPYFATTLNSNKFYFVSSYHPNSMIGQFYTEDQYSQCKIIYNLGLLIALLSFLAFVVGIFSKEVVGLEMVMLCQFAYMSLFYYNGTLQLPLFSLKTLLYSTGYNVPYGQTQFTMTADDSPQSLFLGYDPRTFWSNFNLMSILYILPLLIVIPFIPLKAKCIRKLSMIELGHKWVDLLIGEIYLFCILFNYQYFLLSAIVYYQDGRNNKNYASTMVIFFGGLCTLCSFLGLIFKPEIYGNFRTVFKYDMELLPEKVAEKEKLGNIEEELMSKFEGEKKCESCKSFYSKARLFINENYFWRNFRKAHTILAYNHYTILIAYFTLVTICLAVMKSSQIVIICLSLVLLIQLVLLRPYGQVSQKLRSIYFCLAYILITGVRYYSNEVIQGEYSVMLSFSVLLLLIGALVWTYCSLISYFMSHFRQQMSNRNVVVSKIFNHQNQNTLDKKQDQAEEEQALMRKLMKKYERIQLQYDLNGARNQLLSGFDSINGESRKLLQQSFQNEKKVQGNLLQQIYGQKKQGDEKQSEQLMKKVENTKNFKNLKAELLKQKKTKKKAQMKNKVSGQKLLKLLCLDNFNKYQEQFLKPQESKQKKQSEEKKQELSSDAENQQSRSQKQKTHKQTEQEALQQIESNKTEEYESVEPKTLEQAQKKIEEERILREQNQHIRYKRALKIITDQGLFLDKDLIVKNYDQI